MTMLKPFEIHEPQSVQEASDLLSTYGWDAALYAGGTELLVVMREGLVHYPHLINIKKVPRLADIRLTDDGASLRIGAAATHHAIERSELVAAHAPLLAEMERRVANIRVRVAGTLGGNLSFAEPHSDPATLLTAWDGVAIELTSAAGQRSLSPEEYFIGLFATARSEDEVLTAVTLPLLPPEAGGAYQKFVLLERPTANVAAFVTVRAGVIESASIAVGSVGPVPYRAASAESLLVGQRPGKDLYQAAGDAAALAADPVTDLYGSAEYKRHLVRVLVLRALKQSVERSIGEVLL